MEIIKIIVEILLIYLGPSKGHEGDTFERPLIVILQGHKSQHIIKITKEMKDYLKKPSPEFIRKLRNCLANKGIKLNSLEIKEGCLYVLAEEFTGIRSIAIKVIEKIASKLKGVK